MVEDMPVGEPSDSEDRVESGGKSLLYVASLVMRLRVWAELLREVPDDDVARREVRALAAALVHHGDQHRWQALGKVAGHMIRELARKPDAEAVARIRVFALWLENISNERALGGSDQH